MLDKTREELMESLGELNEAITDAIATWLNESIIKIVVKPYLKDNGLTVNALYDIKTQILELEIKLSKTSKITRDHEKTLLYVRLGIDTFVDKLDIAEATIGQVKEILALRDKIKAVDKAFAKTERKAFRYVKGGRQ